MRLTRTNSLLVLMAVVTICMSGANAMAQRDRGGSGRQGGGSIFGGFGRGNSVLDVASRKDVQEHVGFLKDQIADVEKLREEQRSGLRDRFGGLDFRALRDGTDEEREAIREQIQEKSRKADEAMKAKLRDIVLPHQFERLEQLAIQLASSSGGIMGALRSDTVTTKLGITNRQQDDLRSKASTAEDELRGKIAEIRAEASRKFLTNLTSEQQAKYKKMVGEPFVFVRGFGQGGRGGQTGRGTRGGDRGGDRGGRTGGGRPQRPGQ